MPETRTDLDFPPVEAPPRIGVLALQGAFREHIRALERLGAHAVEVRKPEDLEGLHGLVIPGGESTTIGKLAVSAENPDQFGVHASGTGARLEGSLLPALSGQLSASELDSHNAIAAYAGALARDRGGRIDAVTAPENQVLLRFHPN